MALITQHNVERGITRLLGAPLDLPEAAAEGRQKPRTEAGAAHADLYAAYLRQLPTIFKRAEIWWKGNVYAHIQQGASEEDARTMAFARRLAGPAAEPHVVGLVRRVWRDCAALNATLPLERRVPPQTLLLEWLVDDGYDDFVILLTCMPYWPIGLDDQGRWC